MWYKIRELYSKGFNKTQIAFQLGLHRSTVRRYLKMDEDTLTAKLQHRRRYPRILDKYESYVCDVLSRYRFLSASQIHDWMKEQYPDLPVVCGKTVYNFVEAVRRKYNLDKEGLSKRVYEKMPDTPYGEYAQMDFGESRMSTDRGGFVKVYFFVMVMSRSRQKFVYFSSTPFTSALAVYAHELAFAYFKGKPRKIIYDQDKVLLVRENLGDLILTRTFRAFVNEQHFQPVFCRPADPESKGKVENVVKYVKRNFLAGRTFHSPEILNMWSAIFDVFACVLEGDDEEVYWCCGCLADRSIVVMDGEGNYYHVEKGKGKRYIACNAPKAGEADFASVVEGLRKEAGRRAESVQRERQQNEEEKRRKRLEEIKDVLPFRMEMKWGLKWGDRIVVPPCYRNICIPVGGYCAFEGNACQWGVMALDGKVVVEARYQKVEIEKDGTVHLTIIPGKVKTINL